MHTTLFFWTVLRDSFVSTLINCPDHSLILSGEYCTNAFFCNFLDCFCELPSEINSMILSAISKELIKQLIPFFLLRSRGSLELQSIFTAWITPDTLFKVTPNACHAAMLQASWHAAEENWELKATCVNSKGGDFG